MVRSVSCTSEGCVVLLSLIPHLIKQLRCLVGWWVCGCGWVEHICCLVPNMFRSSWLVAWHTVGS